MKIEKLRSKVDTGGYLDGKMLVAMPSMTDARFARTTIYLCAHSAEGALGIVVNKPASKINFVDLLVQLRVIEARDRILLPQRASSIQVLQGGPVETARGFVLHSADFSDHSTLVVDDDICLTATIDILRAIARGEGPGRAILALGYAGWSPGQLDQEIQANGWLCCPADADLLFDQDLENKYVRSLSRIGVDLAMLSSSAGRA